MKGIREQHEKLIIERQSFLKQLRVKYGNARANVLIDVASAIESGAFEEGKTDLRDIEDTFGERSLIQLRFGVVAIPLHKKANGNSIQMSKDHVYEPPAIPAEGRNWYLICKLDKSKVVSNFTLSYSFLSELNGVMER